MSAYVKSLEDHIEEIQKKCSAYEDELDFLNLWSIHKASYEYSITIGANDETTGIIFLSKHEYKRGFVNCDAFIGKSHKKFIKYIKRCFPKMYYPQDDENKFDVCLCARAMYCKRKYCVTVHMTDYYNEAGKVQKSILNDGRNGGWAL